MKKLASILAGIGFCFSIQAMIEVSEFRHGETACVQVENDFYRIVLVPAHGGRIFSWHDKVAGTSLADAAIPAGSGEKLSFGGLLDDRGDFTYAPYDCRIDRPDTGTVAVSMSAFSAKQQLKIRKILTFKAGSPVINTKYRYENHSYDNIAGFDLGIRNFFYPSGDGVSTADRYYLPTAYTLRRVIGYELKNESDSSKPVEFGDKLITSLNAPWNGFLNLPGRNGLAVSHEDDFYAGFYIWKGLIKYPTYEWTYQTLPAGHARETEFNLIQVNDFDNLALASAGLLASTRVKLDGNTLDLLSTAKLLEDREDVTLRISCRALNGKWTVPDTTHALGNLKKYQNKSAETRFTLPGAGLYEIRQELLAGNSLLGKWQETVPAGGFTTLPVYPKEARKPGASFPIPGWQAPPAPRMDLNKDDEARGFAVLKPLLDNHYRRYEALEIAVAANEFESRELIVVPLTYSGKVNISLHNPEQVPARLRVQHDQILDSRWFGGARPYRARMLFDRNHFELSENISVWLTVGSREKMKSGTHGFEIRIEGSSGAPAVIPVKLKIHDVVLPRRKLVNLEAEGYPMSYPCHENPQILKEWYRNMAEHGIDFFQFSGRMKPGVLNVQELDHYIDHALAAGLVIFKAARYDISKPSPTEQRNWHALSAYLRAKGYQDKDIFVKILDEQPLDKFPAMAATAEWLKASGFRPFSTFHNLLDKPEKMKVLNGMFDMFQGGFTTRADAAARFKDGSLKQDDVLLLYTGTGASPRSYGEMLFWGIQTAALEHDMFHNHEYMRGGNARLGANIIMVGDDHLPVDSAAFEGLRDGMDVANLAAMYRQQRKLLSNQDLQEKFDQRFQRIFDGPEAIFKLHFIQDAGVLHERLAPVTFEQYETGRLQLLALLDEFKHAIRGSLDKHVLIAWNDKKILEPGKTFAITAVRPEEKEAAEFFRNTLSERLGIAPGRMAEGEPGITIVFKLEETPFSYQIKEENGQIILSAASADHLKLAAGNWINTLETREPQKQGQGSK